MPRGDNKTLNEQEQRPILLVEDQAILALAEANTITGFGYKVIIAHTGEKAVELAVENEAISLVLMDIDLGKGIDGPEAARRILSTRTVPIVFLTAHAEKEYVDRVKEITRYGYVIKNSGDFVLQSSIEMAFELFHANNKYHSLSRLLRLMCDNLPDMIWAKDLKNRYIFANEALCRDLLSTADTDEPIGNTDTYFGERECSHHPGDPEWYTFDEVCRDSDDLTMKAGTPQQFNEYGNVKGKFLVLDVHKAPFFDETGKLVGTVGSGRDVTEAKEIERLLQENEERYRRLSEDMPLYICTFLPNSTLTYVNPALAKVLDKEPEEVVGSRFFEMLTPDNTLLVRESLASLTPDNPTETHEQSYIAPEGHKRFQQWTNRAFFDNAGQVVYCQAVGLDTTERKQAEESQKQAFSLLQATLESTADGILVVDLAGKVRSFNQKFAKMWRIPQQLLDTHDEGKLLSFVFSQLKDLDAFTDQLNALYAQPDRQSFDTIEFKDRRIFERYSQPQRIDGTIVGRVWSFRDITTHERAEEQIRSLLAEKEILLREVHHRIKNHMNVIMSLLSLQSSTSQDPSTASSLKEARSRVQSMMILYDKLYRSRDFRSISAKEYLASLAGEIVANFPNRAQVTLETKIDDVSLGTEILSPVGIIINELITNAMKHAFVEREEGLIVVSFSLKDNHASLVVFDNGVGVPESFNIENSAGFGMQLVSMLTEQLEGTIRLGRGKETRFVLEFDM